MKHAGTIPRHRDMHALIRHDRPLRPVAKTALRTASLVAGVMLLILVLLPAAIAAQAATI